MNKTDETLIKRGIQIEKNITSFLSPRHNVPPSLHTTARIVSLVCTHTQHSFDNAFFSFVSLFDLAG